MEWLPHMPAMTAAHGDDWTKEGRRRGQRCARTYQVGMDTGRACRRGKSRVRLQCPRGRQVARSATNWKCGSTARCRSVTVIESAQVSSSRLRVEHPRGAMEQQIVLLGGKCQGCMRRAPMEAEGFLQVLLYAQVALGLWTLCVAARVWRAVMRDEAVSY